MPPRSHRNRTISYNLASRSGLSEDEDEDFDQRNHMGSSPGSRSNRPRNFLTSASRGNGEWSGSEAQAVDMANLFDLFPHAEKNLVKEVFAGCENDFERALACLSEMTSETQNNNSNHHPIESDKDSSSSQVKEETPADKDASRTSWDDLPTDCIDLILSSLPARDVARCAPTNRDFARRVHLGAINAKVLTIPLGLTLNAIMGMVSGHPNAHTVSLARWSAEGPLTERDLTALVSTINTASRSSRRNTPVESISFKGWSWLNNGHIMLICSTMQHLKELDLTDCSGISDAALIEISKYRRTEKEEEEEEVVELFVLRQPSSTTTTAAAGPSSPPHLFEGDGERQEGTAGASDDEDELQFEMEASEPSPKPSATSALKGRPPRGPPSVTLSYGLPFSPAFGSKGVRGGSVGGGGGGGGGGSRREEEEEARYESLALLAATSPPPPSSSWMAAVALSSRTATALGSSTSPPSNLGSGILNHTSSRSSSISNTGTTNIKVGSPIHLGGSADPAGSSFMILGSSLGATATANVTATAGGTSSPFLGSSPPSMAMSPVGSWQARGGVGGGSLRGGLAIGSPGWIGAWDRKSGGGGGGGPAMMGGGGPAMMGSSPLGTSPLQPSPLSAMNKAPKISTATGPGLRSLVLAGCSMVTGEGVRKFLDSPLVKSSLEALDISRCYKMSRQALSIPPASCLKVLKCSGCGNLHEVIIQLPPTCPLTELHLNNCKALTRLHIVASNLKLLHVGGCKVLTNISLKTPQLATLLANLTFRWAEINPDQWICPKLQHVNLFGARHLDTASLSVILNNSPGIKHLNLNGCNTVSRIDLSADGCRELTTLDVSACKGLSLLRLQGAEQLKEVQAKACPRLVECQVEARALQKIDLSHCAVLSTLSIPAIALQRPQDMWQVEVDAVGTRRLGLPDGLTLTRVIVSRWLAEKNFSNDTMLRIRLLKEAIAAELAAKAAENRV